MTDRNAILDSKAPLKYVRHPEKLKYKPNEVKFSYDYDLTITETIKEKEGTTVKEITKEYTDRRNKKVMLSTYTHSSEEDAEHFFEAFERMKKELKKVWDEASTAKDKDATILFQAFECMVDGVAAAGWRTVLKEEKSRTWETFKTKVSIYICTKVLERDAYNQQKTYLNERTKPMKLDAVAWNNRIELISLRLPLMFETMADFKLECPDADFKGWWTDGELSEAEHRRIVLNKAPQEWKDQLDLSDVKHEYRKLHPREIIEYYQTIESKEKSDNVRRKRQQRKASSKTYDGNRRAPIRQEDQHRTRDSAESNRYRRYGRGSGYSKYNRGDNCRYYSPRNREDKRRHDQSQSGGQQTRDRDHTQREHPKKGETYYHSESDSDDSRRHRRKHHPKIDRRYEEEEAHLIDTWNDQWASDNTPSEMSLHHYSSSEDYSDRS